MTQPNATLATIAPPEDLSDLIADCQVFVGLLVEVYGFEHIRIQRMAEAVVARILEHEGSTQEEAKAKVLTLTTKARRDPLQVLLFELKPRALGALWGRLSKEILSRGGAIQVWDDATKTHKVIRQEVAA